MSQEPDTLSSTKNEAAKQPSSARKIASSQANGNLSQGPKTHEGKLKCATAAALQIKHGLLAQTVVLNGESPTRFSALLNSFVAACRPITEPEHVAVTKMVVAYWRQMRAWSIQKIDFDREMSRQDDSAPAPFRATLAFHSLIQDNKMLDTTLRYEAAFERQFSRALRDLAKLKSQRDPTAGLDSIPTDLPSTTWEQND